MNRSPAGDVQGGPDWRESLAARLRERSHEMEKAIYAEIQRLCEEPIPEGDPWYADGVRKAVAAGVCFAIEVVAESGARPALIPPEILRQARRAAENGVSLEVVLQRHTIAAGMVVEFVAAETTQPSAARLSQVLSDLRSESAALAAAVANEYRAQINRERDQLAATSRILDFLAGTVASPPGDVDYRFDRWHLGFILVGARARAVARDLGTRAPVSYLQIPREPQLAFAWFGTDALPDRARLEQAILTSTPNSISVAIGEAREGVEGWRQTHQESQLALRVLLRRPERLMRWRDKVLSGAVLGDAHTVASLKLTFLDPLVGAGGPELLQTLRAYFRANRNVEAASSALGANRKTVERHLRKVERSIGGQLGEYESQLRMALELQELAEPANARPKSSPRRR